MLPHKFKSCSDKPGVLVELTSEKQMQFNCQVFQYAQGVERYFKGEKIQDAFPFLTPDEREFLLSGLTPEEFDTWTKNN